MELKLCSIDFEYNSSSEEKLNLVSCSLSADNYKSTLWLHRDKARNESLRNDIIRLHRKGYTFLAWNVMAEARSFYSLGLNPIKFKWIDLYLEYRMLTNHNHNFQYGKQLIKGKKKFTSPPPSKWDMSEEERRKKSYDKPEHNLLAAIYKLLGKYIPPEIKDESRDLILSNPQKFTLEEQKKILLYNESDIKYLPLLTDKIFEEYKRLLGNLPPTLIKEMLLRGEYAARTAVMESIGYPISYRETKAFSDSVSDILWEIQNEINQLFPDIHPFEKDMKKGNRRNFVWKQKKTREWVEKQKHKGWLLTDKKQLSLSLEAFKEFYDFRHNFPDNNFGAQMVRYLTLKQNLNGFSPNSKNSLWDYVGSDQRVRPYFGIYGAQSARSQPKATGFLFLKSAWMRGLVKPPKGKVIWGIDYKSQEFLLGALLSNDSNMLSAYKSGDPYLYFAKIAGAVPKDGKKENYKTERDLFKSTTLGISYGMMKNSLAVKLTNDMGFKVSVRKAEWLIRKFERAYKEYTKYRKNIIRLYRKQNYLKLPDGWYLWGDNWNDRSVQNFPIQGLGSCIMRKAVSLAQDSGLKVIMTLHDALYIEADLNDWAAGDYLARCMDEAFRFYFPKRSYGDATVGLEGNVWGEGLEEGYRDCDILKEVKTQPTYVDSRSLKEYEKFKKYFIPEEKYEI